MAYSVPATHLLNKPILQGLQASSATAVHSVGDKVQSSDGKEFQYVYFASTGTVYMYTARPIVWSDTTGDYVVDCDVSTAEATRGFGHGFAGVSTFANGDINAMYMWIQTKGLVDSAWVSTSVAVNDPLVAKTDDLFDDTVTFSSLSTTIKINAIALTAAAAGAGTGYCSTASIMLL